MSSVSEYYFAGSGEAFLAEKDPVSGLPGAFRPIGHIEVLNTSVSVQTQTIKDARQDFKNVRRWSYGQTVELSLTTKNLNLDNLRTFFGGESSTIPAGSVVDEPLALDLREHPNVPRDCQILYPRLGCIDPATVVVSLYDYRLDTIFALDPANYTVGECGEVIIEPTYIDDINTNATFGIDNDQPGSPGAVPNAPYNKRRNLIVSYDHGQIECFGAGSTDDCGCQPRYWLKIKGRNLAECGQLQLVDLFNVTLEPSGGFDLVSEEPTMLEFTGEILADDSPVREANPQYGSFMHVQRYGCK